ncbi:hypothetical protein WG66_006762 [Moniliophthora roreri]|nr:hypothetical protein WG66_006762 [Moniliophthora roreri]
MLRAGQIAKRGAGTLALWVTAGVVANTQHYFQSEYPALGWRILAGRRKSDEWQIRDDEGLIRRHRGARQHCRQAEIIFSSLGLDFGLSQVEDHWAARDTGYLNLIIDLHELTRKAI